jgi:hypothetical protein
MIIGAVIRAPIMMPVIVPVVWIPIMMSMPTMVPIVASVIIGFLNGGSGGWCCHGPPGGKARRRRRVCGTGEYTAVSGLGRNGRYSQKLHFSHLRVKIFGSIKSPPPHVPFGLHLMTMMFPFVLARGGLDKVSAAKPLPRPMGGNITHDRIRASPLRRLRRVARNSAIESAPLMDWAKS